MTLRPINLNYKIAGSPLYKLQISAFSNKRIFATCLNLNEVRLNFTTQIMTFNDFESRLTS